MKSANASGTRKTEATRPKQFLMYGYSPSTFRTDLAGLSLTLVASEKAAARDHLGRFSFSI
jgi:hypothetical protein